MTILRSSALGGPPSPSVPRLSLTVKGPRACAHRDEYFRMKVQWKSVSEEQEMRNSLLRGYRSLIGQSVKDKDQQAFGRANGGAERSTCVLL